MGRLDTERQKLLEPGRIDNAVKSITSFGYVITYYDNTKIKFNFKNEEVTFFPYSGWHTGKSIKDGRGLKKLLDQIKNQNK